MARRPKPTALKLLQGNPGKRAFNQQEPQLIAECPDPPAWLTKRGRELWAELGPLLVTARIMTKADASALALLCEAYALFRHARMHVRRDGLTYTSETEGGGTMVKARPEVAIMQDSWRQIRLMLVEFGLTPAARSKVSAVGLSEKDPMEAILRGQA